MQDFRNNPLDILFLIDSSSGIKEDTFKSFTSFAETVTARYKLSANYTQVNISLISSQIFVAKVGAITLADLPKIGFDLNVARTHDDLAQNLHGLKFSNVTGQNLTAFVAKLIIVKYTY